MDIEDQSGGTTRHYLKMCAKYLGMIFGAFALLIIISYIIEVYTQRKELREGTQRVKNLAEAMKQAGEDSYARAMADTYGGKTPQETLQLYITAVEKGDYELASKYFIGDYQEKELEGFKNANATPEKVNKFLSFLKTAMLEGGVYSPDGKEYIGNSKLLIRLKLYPNGIWKIIEI